MSTPAGPRYRIDGKLASGGMSTVWRAWDTNLGRPVAVKRLRVEVAARPSSLERFRREILASASLSHPGLLQVFDAGRDHLGPYLVMELVEGELLSALLARLGRLSARRSAAVAHDLAGALAHLHRRGLVHRDVKPGNVLITGSGETKLADLGICQRIGRREEPANPGVVLGTPTYFSPEQAAGEQATPASDLYALGLVLYEMLAGRPPFRAKTPLALAMAHLYRPPPPPSRFVRVPAALEAVAMRALEKDPRDRFVSGDAMAAALRSWQRAASRPKLRLSPVLRSLLLS
ncbi:MAG: serine/threonine-protein kinase [Acidimicrobiia bacterium]